MEPLSAKGRLRLCQRRVQQPLIPNTGRATKPLNLSVMNSQNTVEVKKFRSLQDADKPPLFLAQSPNRLAKFSLATVGAARVSNDEPFPKPQAKQIPEVDPVLE